MGYLGVFFKDIKIDFCSQCINIITEMHGDNYFLLNFDNVLFSVHFHKKNVNELI